ncbi:transaldolase [Mycobacterium bohemicum DSM 44277]|uniref:Transaldolase n=1 Tax=Mycobacterium bohemicum DSM 44277 TaxID=1236609 RepID=A0A0U0WEH6_MYCBE|nr:transaldolase [Mycobacterium bohemicum DSM 44277]
MLDRLAAIGIDYDDVVTHLEDDGIEKFDAAWDHLANQLADALSNDRERMT